MPWPPPLEPHLCCPNAGAYSACVSFKPVWGLFYHKSVKMCLFRNDAFLTPCLACLTMRMTMHGWMSIFDHPVAVQVHLHLRLSPHTYPHPDPENGNVQANKVDNAAAAIRPLFFTGPYNSGAGMERERKADATLNYKRPATPQCHNYVGVPTWQ